jgi:hypothetical protein
MQSYLVLGPLAASLTALRTHAWILLTKDSYSRGATREQQLNLHRSRHTLG